MLFRASSNSDRYGKVLHKIDALIFEEKSSNAFESLPDAGIVARASPLKIVAVTQLSWIRDHSRICSFVFQLNPDFLLYHVK